jgi:hypothetical protein
MHNLHLCVVRAKNAVEAEETVDEAISDWGGENNWRSICGSISEKNEVHISGEGRFPPGDNDTIADVNKMFNGWVGHPEIGAMGIDSGSTIKETLQKIIDGQAFDQKSAHKLNTVQRYIGALYERAVNGLTAGGEPDVFTHEYYARSLNECGVTHIGDPNDTEQQDDGEPNDSKQQDDGDRYVVFVDMHS